MIADFLTSEAFLSFLATLAALIFGGNQGYKLWDRAKDRRVKIALLILESAIITVYEDYVRELKQSTESGKLPPEDRARARALALERAIALAESHGIDLVNLLGKPYLTAYIERVLKKIKHGFPVL